MNTNLAILCRAALKTWSSKCFLTSRSLWCGKNTLTYLYVRRCAVPTGNGLLHTQTQSSHLNLKFRSKLQSLLTISPFERSYSSRTCWKCGEDTHPEKELFFCECGVVQKPATDLTFFKLLQIEQGFDIDTIQLSQKFKDTQRRLHPDKFSAKSREELSYAEEQSSLLNKSYDTLLKPLNRAIYLLELDGETISENDSVSDPAFLMDMMEDFETIENASKPEEVEALGKSNQSRIDNCVQELKQAFEQKDLLSAKSWTIKLRYYTTIEERIKELILKSYE